MESGLLIIPSPLAKTKAPFWKKEKTSSGDRWVEERVTDEHAADRWKVR